MQIAQICPRDISPRARNATNDIVKGKMRHVGCRAQNAKTEIERSDRKTKVHESEYDTNGAE
jgi:hypothetical protein